MYSFLWLPKRKNNIKNELVVRLIQMFHRTNINWFLKYKHIKIDVECNIV
jgi:hypothetical protein